MYSHVIQCNLIFSLSSIPSFSVTELGQSRTTA